MSKDFLMKRTGSKVKVEGKTASIPDNVSMISIFSQNAFISDGEYREDGWIYVGGVRKKKWFKNIENVSVWFPILKDLRKLQDRFLAVEQKRQDYIKKTFRRAFNKVMKVGIAHAKVTHKFEGGDDPWWLYRSNKYPNQQGLIFDWVKTPKEPINQKIGDAYYKAEQRLQQLGGRAFKFRSVLEHAINKRIHEIKGLECQGQILQFKIGDRSYWFKKYMYTWEKLAFPEDDVLKVEV